MTPTVRAYSAADAPAWVALSNLFLSRVDTLEAFEAKEARRDPAHLNRRWVAGSGAEVRGLAHLFVFPFDPPGFLHARILVHPDVRGRGIGRTLWTALEQAAREAGAVGLAADVTDTEPGSLTWAERRGFRQHAHRFASELDLTGFDEAPHVHALAQAEAQGTTFTDLSGADETTLERYLHFVADRLTETPDLAGQPRWSLAQVRGVLHLDHDPRFDWLLLVVGSDGAWLGTTAMVAYQKMAYNELTAVHPQARGRGLALPLKLLAIRRAQQAGLTVMRTHNHSANARLLS